MKTYELEKALTDWWWDTLMGGMWEETMAFYPLVNHHDWIADQPDAEVPEPKQLLIAVEWDEDYDSPMKMADDKGWDLWEVLTNCPVMKERGYTLTGMFHAQEQPLMTLVYFRTGEEK